MERKRTHLVSAAGLRTILLPPTGKGLVYVLRQVVYTWVVVNTPDAIDIWTAGLSMREQDQITDTTALTRSVMLNDEGIMATTSLITSHDTEGTSYIVPVHVVPLQDIEVPYLTAVFRGVASAAAELGIEVWYELKRRPNADIAYLVQKFGGQARTNPE